MDLVCVPLFLLLVTDLSYEVNVLCTIQVELAHGGRGTSYDRSSSYSSSGRRGGAARRSDYRGLYSNFKLHNFFREISLFLLSLSWITVMVTGLPSSASWQDLKVCM